MTAEFKEQHSCARDGAFWELYEFAACVVLFVEEHTYSDGMANYCYACNRIQKVTSLLTRLNSGLTKDRA